MTVHPKLPKYRKPFSFQILSSFPGSDATIEWIDYLNLQPVWVQFLFSPVSIKLSPEAVVMEAVEIEEH